MTSDPGSLRRVGRDTIIYGAGVVMQRLASAIMLPVYTHLLMPDDYGLLQMLMITLDVAAILVSAGMTHGVMRFYYKAQTQDEKNRVITSAIVLFVGLNLIGTALILAGSDLIWKNVLDSRGELWYVWIAAANFTIQSFSAVPLLYMQIRQESIRYSITSLAQVTLALSLNILFLVVFDMGPVAILLSTLVTAVIIGATSTSWTLKQTGTSISKSAMKDLRRFGVPYQFVTAGTFILTFGDRFFLQNSAGLAAVGQYGLAYQFGFLFMGLGPGPIMKAWTPFRHKQLGMSREERDKSYNLAFRWFTFFSCILAAAMALAAAPGLRIMASAEYQSAVPLIPVILLAYVFQAWTEVVQFGIDVSERTIFSTYATWASTIVILGLYVWLIPLYGPMGAAWATVLAFALRLVLFAIAANRLMPLNYEWAPHIAALVCGTGVVLLETFMRPDGFWGQVVMSTGCLLLFIVLSVLFVLNSHDRHQLFASISKSPLASIRQIFSS